MTVHVEQLGLGRTWQLNAGRARGSGLGRAQWKVETQYRKGNEAQRGTDPDEESATKPSLIYHEGARRAAGGKAAFPITAEREFDHNDCWPPGRVEHRADAVLDGGMQPEVLLTCDMAAAAIGSTAVSQDGSTARVALRTLVYA